ncbi:MAG TPA: DUF2062 domain-containing protein [Tepidisphaeraceae bacterium]|jgi:hypothetical protein|nr:DUF2062 domain-containing protein [Tepidisphaeraceae bacterium]
MPRPRHGQTTRWGKLIHNPNLWHLNRHSVARAIALGVFWSFAPPIPFLPTLAATLLAIRCRANVAIAVAFTWVNNPLTIAPASYLSYSVGRMLLRRNPMPNFQPTSAWIHANFPNIWLPYGIGSLVVSFTLAGLSYLLAQEYWKWRITRRWRQRKHRMHDIRSEIPV